MRLFGMWLFVASLTVWGIGCGDQTGQPGDLAPAPDGAQPGAPDGTQPGAPANGLAPEPGGSGEQSFPDQQNQQQPLVPGPGEGQTAPPDGTESTLPDDGAQGELGLNNNDL